MPLNEMTRRDALKAMAFTGGTLVAAGAGTYFLFREDRTAQEICGELSAAIQGSAVTDRIVLADCERDWGLAIHRKPKIVVAPRAASDIAATLKMARQCGVPVTVRGAGHSCHGQTLTDGGIVILNKREEPEVEVRGDEVTVSTATSWMALEKWLNARGLTSPVLTDYLEMTVGGTLSVGGYGPLSHRLGSQCDQVTEIELVTADGETVRCSERENAELFKYSLCGFGQLGVMTRARYRAVPFKKHSVMVRASSTEARTYLESIEALHRSGLLAETDHYHSYWFFGRFTIEVTADSNDASDPKLAVFERSMRQILGGDIQASRIEDRHFKTHAMVKRFMGVFRRSHKLLSDYCFHYGGWQEFIRTVFSSERFEKTREMTGLFYFGAGTGRLQKKFPFCIGYERIEDYAFSAGQYFMPRLGDRQGLEEAKRHLAENLALALELGGRPYLYGWHDLSSRDKERVYGADYARLKQLKAEIDPQGLLNPGALIDLRGS